MWYRLVMVTHGYGESSLYWMEDRAAALAAMRRIRSAYGLRAFLRKVDADGTRIKREG